jgi:hypothetical protein
MGQKSKFGLFMVIHLCSDDLCCDRYYSWASVGNGAIMDLARGRDEVLQKKTDQAPSTL